MRKVFTAVIGIIAIFMLAMVFSGCDLLFSSPNIEVTNNSSWTAEIQYKRDGTTEWKFLGGDDGRVSSDTTETFSLIDGTYDIWVRDWVTFALGDTDHYYTKAFYDVVIEAGVPYFITIDSSNTVTFD